jgi:hypothetical protein
MTFEVIMCDNCDYVVAAVGNVTVQKVGVVPRYYLGGPKYDTPIPRSERMQAYDDGENDICPGCGEGQLSYKEV